MTTVSSIAGHVNSANKLLEINNLNVEYYAANGTVHALTDVSITLERGQILGVAGESGSGKSTLAYAITRLLRPPAVITGGQILYYPQAGSRLLDNTSAQKNSRSQKHTNSSRVDASPQAMDILQLTPTQLRAFRWSELSIVFQSAMNALNPVLDIGTQIIDVLRTHRPTLNKDARRARAVELLRLVGIAPDRIHSYPHELSGGMRQRAIIAIALALSPELIILDEPTTALDVVVQREILAKIIGLRNEFGFSVIFITHDLSLLLEMADKVAIMYAGRVVEMATCRELHQQPRHPYSYGLLNSFPTLHGPRRRMTGIPGFPPDLRAVPSGCAFHPRCPCAFAACDKHLPRLLPSTPETPEQVVACHLYDPRFNTEEPPSNADFAAKYEANYEAIQERRNLR
ncbi:MAG TPA: ABC transporter ATP-binding protein [Ktedonobacteraceae bacterium]|nr:ABC transporter ATP-binding protein [Ktedonobacteraceae bacterium]